MRVVIASTPAAGHINPVAAIGRILIAEGHEVIGLSGNAFRKRFEDIGAGFHPLPASADPDFQNIASFVPELKSLPDGTPRLVRSRIILGRAFIDTIRCSTMRCSRSCATSTSMSSSATMRFSVSCRCCSSPAQSVPP
jgi:hypothetical protein